MDLRKLMNTVIDSAPEEWHLIADAPSYHDHLEFYDTYHGQPNVLHAEAHHSTAGTSLMSRSQSHGALSGGGISRKNGARTSVILTRLVAISMSSSTMLSFTARATCGWTGYICRYRS